MAAGPYTVLGAGDGPAALALLATSPRLDLVLSDVVLPGGMSGPDFYDKARQERPELKCLFMSGYAELPARELPEGIELLGKPFRMRELAQRIRATLDA